MTNEPTSTTTMMTVLSVVESGWAPVSAVARLGGEGTMEDDGMLGTLLTTAICVKDTLLLGSVDRVDIGTVVVVVICVVDVVVVVVDGANVVEVDEELDEDCG